MPDSPPPAPSSRVVITQHVHAEAGMGDRDGQAVPVVRLMASGIRYGKGRKPITTMVELLLPAGTPVADLADRLMTVNTEAITTATEHNRAREAASAVDRVPDLADGPGFITDP